MVGNRHPLQTPRSACPGAASLLYYAPGLFVSAVDTDECVTGINKCGHVCVNTLGSYRCRCRRGYRLHDNGFDCIGMLFVKTFPKVATFFVRQISVYLDLF